MRTAHCYILIAAAALTMDVAAAATTYTVTNTASSGSGSLANAITLANANLDTSTIRFSIAGDCPRVIPLSDTLSIRTNVVINGYTQSGSVENSSETQWNGKICVVLDGHGVVGTGIATHPLINQGMLEVKGIAFEGFETAILLPYGRLNFVHGNRFGGRIYDHELSGNGNAVTVALAATANIGAYTARSRNIIGSSRGAGVVLTAGSTGNSIEGNLIGDLRFGDNISNQDGIQVYTSGNFISHNHIGQNRNDGILLTTENAFDNEIADNDIGALPDVTTSGLGNGRMGVMVENGAHSNVIRANTINRNRDSGIRVMPSARDRNDFFGNNMALNRNIAIDLGNSGVNPNNPDPIVCVSGGCAANRGQNYPVFDTADFLDGGTSTLVLEGRLTTSYSTQPYRIDVHVGPACDASGYGQGEFFLASRNVVVSQTFGCTTSCGKSFSMQIANPGMVHAGDAITATATSSSGDTSEFSACVIVGGADVIFIDGFE